MVVLRGLADNSNMWRNWEQGPCFPSILHRGLLSHAQLAALGTTLQCRTPSSARHNSPPLPCLDIPLPSKPEHKQGSSPTNCKSWENSFPTFSTMISVVSLSLTLLYNVYVRKHNCYPSFVLRKAGGFLDTCFARVRVWGHWLTLRGKEVTSWASRKQPRLLRHFAHADLWDQLGLSQGWEGQTLFS